jgi:hypothetical protein
MSDRGGIYRVVRPSTLLATALVILGAFLTKRPGIQAHDSVQNAPAACTLATITGEYGAVSSGTYLTVGPESAVGVVTFNGTGSLEYNFTVNVNGTVSTASFSGTYTLNPNCSGTLTYSDGETFAAVVVNKGMEIDLISTNAGSVQTGTAKKL